VADLDDGLAVGADYAVHHAVGVERSGDMALAVESDDAAFAFLRNQLFHDHVVGGLFERDVEIADAGADVCGDGVAQVEFADAGAPLRFLSRTSAWTPAPTVTEVRA
jgi:hypothetical protein